MYMGEELEMKYTDFAILFIALSICFVVPLELRSRLLERMMSQKIIYNNIFDTAVMDALQESYWIDSSEAYIDHEKLIYYLERNIKECLSGFDTNKALILITREDGFYYRYKAVTEFVQYEDVMNYEDKINLLRDNIEKNINLMVSIPYIENEEWYNTVAADSILFVYIDDKMSRNKISFEYDNIYVSGARVRKRIA